MAEPEHIKSKLDTFMEQHGVDPKEIQVAPEIAATFRPNPLKLVQPLEVPPQFANVSFETYVPVTESQFRALKIARRWVEAIKKGEKAPMFALVGATGSGKTHLMYAAIKEIHAHKPTTRIASRPWYVLADQLRYGGPAFWAAGFVEAESLRRQCLRADILALDEARATAGTTFDDVELSKFVLHAYDQQRAMFLTSNLKMKEFIGAAAASRLTILEVNGPDHRATHP